jgi:hypothetical protein
MTPSHRWARTVCRASLLSLLPSVLLLGACATSDYSNVGGSVYVGVGYSDPWYWGPCCYPTPPAGVGPPPATPPGGGAGAPHPEHPIASPPGGGAGAPHPEHPIATPPAAAARPMPSPRPAATPRGGGGRRR